MNSKLYQGSVPYKIRLHRSETTLRNLKRDSERDSIECWRTENNSTDQLEVLVGNQNKFRTNTSVSRRKRLAQTKERGHSLLQYCNVVQIARLVFCKAMDPTLHYKMKTKRL